MTPVKEIYQKWLDMPNDVDFNNWLSENIGRMIDKERDIVIESYCNGALDIWEDDSIFPRETAVDYYNKI